MNVNDIADFLNVSRSIRQAGSTESLVNGAKFSKDAVIVTATQYEANRLKKDYRVNAKPISSNFRGMKCPILIDKWTVEEMLTVMFNELSYYSKLIQQRDEKLRKIREML